MEALRNEGTCIMNLRTRIQDASFVSMTVIFGYLSLATKVSEVKELVLYRMENTGCFLRQHDIAFVDGDIALT